MHVHEACTGGPFRRRLSVARAAGQIVLISALLALWAGGARAQLGPGDLQRAHALTANSAGWVALRSAMRRIVEAKSFVGEGTAEDTADTLAVILALEDGQGNLDSILTGAVRGALTAYAASDADASRGFANNGLTIARAKAIACMIYGRAPERTADMAEALELSETEAEYCPTAYARLRDHWLKEAAPLRAADSGPGEPATVELAPAAGAMASARAVLISGQTLNVVGTFISTALASPTALLIRSAPCEDGSSPAPDEIRVCYELVGDLAAGIERGIVAGR